MKHPIKFFYTCPKCEHEQEVAVIEPVEAYISGPPESCYPAEGGEVDSGGVCDGCGFNFDEGTLIDKASEIARDRAQDC